MNYCPNLNKKLNTLLILGFIFLSFACDNKKSSADKMPQLYAQPQTFPLKMGGDGYKINPFTGDSVKPIINNNGDTLKTGVPIPSIGKVIHPDSIAKPIIITKEQPNFQTSLPNIHKIPTKLTITALHLDSIKAIKPLETDSNYFVFNLNKDTIFIGDPIALKGKTAQFEILSQKKTTSPEDIDISQIKVKRIGIEQGLNSNDIYSILKDSRGHMWFGTSNGIVKYDGERYFNFKIEGHSRVYNYINKIIEDKKGNIWFGTSFGLFKFDGKNLTKYSEKEGLLSNRIYDILEDSKKNIWCVTYGNLMKICNDTLIHYTNKEGLLGSRKAIVEDHKGNIWIGTYRGIIIFNGGNFKFLNKKNGLPNENVTSLFEDKSRNLWIGTKEGAYVYSNESLTRIGKKEGLLDSNISHITDDENGNIWISSSEGVNLLNHKEIRNYTFERLRKNSISTIISDPKGNLWMGTHGGGVNILKLTSFNHFTTKEGFANNHISTIYEDKKGVLWLGATDVVNIFYKNKIAVIYRTEEDSHHGFGIYAIIEDYKNTLWVGGTQGIIKYNGNEVSKYPFHRDMYSDFTKYLYNDRNKNLWIGTMRLGVFRKNENSTIQFDQSRGLSSNTINSITEDSLRNIWFGTENLGVNFFDGKNISFFTEKEGLPSNYITTMHYDKLGNVWLGTLNSGLILYNKNGFTHFSESQGLSNKWIRSIMEDANHTIWIGTSKGLNCILPLTKENSKYRIFSFGKQDGLKDAEFNENSAYFSSQNQAWWGTSKCLTMLDLNNFKIPTTPPSMQFNYIEINEQFYDFHNLTQNDSLDFTYSNAKPWYNYPNDLVLDYDKNHLTFHFVAIDNYAALHKIKYTYKIEGIDKGWSAITNEAVADYRNLPYGKHTFIVRSIGEAQIWSAPFEYTFTILPPWWHTWWARTGYALSLLLLIYGIIRWQTAKLKTRQKELEDHVDIATTEIREQKENIEVAHKEIKSSINYARRIQSAILPPPRIVKEYLKDSFILYKPKDIVAGDFYWMEHKNNKVLFAAADCTGHGVPGAMVSVVCHNALNRSVREFGLTEPGKILDKTRDIVVTEFDKSDEEVKDGMDIALCTIEGNTLHYAGAHNPLWIIRNEELLETKANKQPIGKYDNPKPYTTHTVNLEKGDTLYIFTDGYVDQFGGEKGKKFMVKSFRKLILSIQDKTMEEQKTIIDHTFEQWKGDLDQVDDVCVIGVRV